MEEEPKKEKERKEKIIIKKTSDLLKLKLDRLMANPEKPAFIPDKPKQKLPSAFRPPEFVRNVWGSSAGAGSGDFHVYRGVRRREYARQKFMNEKSRQEELDAAFKEKLEKNKQVAEEKTSKKRKKRMKAKERKKLKKGNHEGGIGKGEQEDSKEKCKKDDGGKDDEANCGGKDAEAICGGKDGETNCGGNENEDVEDGEDEKC